MLFENHFKYKIILSRGPLVGLGLLVENHCSRDYRLFCFESPFNVSAVKGKKVDIKEISLVIFLCYSSLHNVCSLTKQRECSPVTPRQCTHMRACFLHLIRLVLHCASCRQLSHKHTSQHTSAVQCRKSQL